MIFDTENGVTEPCLLEKFPALGGRSPVIGVLCHLHYVAFGSGSIREDA